MLEITLKFGVEGGKAKNTSPIITGTRIIIPVINNTNKNAIDRNFVNLKALAFSFEKFFSKSLTDSILIA
ncbi:hypothetical protein II941_03620 [bacterium]|nr:hypothetical protein [bacterium]